MGDMHQVTFYFVLACAGVDCITLVALCFLSEHND